ncbi:MAG: protein TolR [Deltaproteobacteria bacterium]|nr:protein TolR [Deltaproteobacteria bacterium]
MAFSSERNNEALSQINVTPLVDVMLVLLVIFMVTAPIMHQGVDVNLPKVQAGGLSGEEVQLVVTVAAGGATYLNDASMAPSELATKLQAILRERPDRNVYLRADEAVPYGDVMRVIGALREAGVQRLGMITEPPARPS